MASLRPPPLHAGCASLLWYVAYPLKVLHTQGLTIVEARNGAMYKSRSGLAGGLSGD